MRLIDADVLEEIVQSYLRENPHKDGFARVCHRPEYTHFLNVIRRMPTIVLPFNEPLTIEELQKMNLDLVWIKPLMPISGLVEGYNVKRGSLSTKFIFSCGFPKTVPDDETLFLWYSDYGKTWLAYRCRPEEDDNEAD